MKNSTLNEGLRPNDLAKMVHPIFEVDTYCSKMGEDRDVCVVSFLVKERAPAKDLMEFIERGYTFVLDSDISSGENEAGEYTVFVELPRTADLIEHIDELVYGVKKLSGLDEFKFKYHKTPTLLDVNEETLTETIPSTPAKYDIQMNGIRTESIKQFFNKTVMHELTVNEDVITIHKPYGQQISLKIVSEDNADKIVEDNAPVTLDEDAIAEMFWLSKVLGDYNIQKIGENLLFNNNNKSMLLQRID